MPSAVNSCSGSEHSSIGKQSKGVAASVQDVIHRTSDVDATRQPFPAKETPPAAAAATRQHDSTCIGNATAECTSTCGSFVSYEDSQCTAAQFSSFSANSVSQPSFVRDYSTCSTVDENHRVVLPRAGFEPGSLKSQSFADINSSKHHNRAPAGEAVTIQTHDTSSDVHRDVSEKQQRQQQQQQDEAEEKVPLLVIYGSDAPLANDQQQQQKQENAWYEVVTFALPMLATLAADPLAQLVDTAYVGHLGAVQLAGVGMAMNIFTSITRLFNAPLLAVTTSSVAAAAAAEEAGTTTTTAAAAAAAAADHDASPKVITGDQVPGSSSSSTDLEVVLDEIPSPSSKSLLPAAAAALLAPAWPAADVESDLEQPLLQKCAGSDVTSDTAAAAAGSSLEQQQQQQQDGLSCAVSASLWLALSFSLIQVVILTAGSESLSAIWGAPESSPLHKPTKQFLVIRGFAAPVTLLLLVLQGVFRGMKDAKTPFYATVICNVLNIALEPLFIWPLGLGVRGSALATAIAQSLPVMGLFVVLQRCYNLKVTQLMTKGLDWKSLGSMFAPTGFLLLRTLSISAVFAAATSLVARAGPLAAAAHQVAFQVWLASSLLADSLAVACQTLMARATAAGQYEYARKIVVAAVAMATGLGFVLAIALGAGIHAIPGLFTPNVDVLKLAGQLMPIVAVTQPLNALAFVLDGVLYGAGGFKYASASMLLCATPSLGLMFVGQGFLNPNAANTSKTPATQPLPDLHAGAYSLGSSNPTPAAAGFSNLAAAAAAAWGYDSRVSGHNDSDVNNMYKVTHPYTLTTTISWSGQSYNALSGPAWTPAAAAAAGSSGSHLAAAAAGAGSSALSEAAAAADVMPAAVLWVWAGLVMLMIMRAVTILVPLLCRCYPFRCLYIDKMQQQQQHDDDSSSSSSSSRKATNRFSTRWLRRAKHYLIPTKSPGPAAAAAAAAAALEEPLLSQDEESAGSSADHTLPAAQQQQHWILKSHVTTKVTAEITQVTDDHVTVLFGESPGSSSSNVDEDGYSSSFGSSSSSGSNCSHCDLDSPAVS